MLRPHWSQINPSTLLIIVSPILLFDKILLSMDGSIGGLFLLVKLFFYKLWSAAPMFIVGLELILFRSVRNTI